MCSKKGYMTADTFVEWFRSFCERIPKKRPVVLLLDGHASHLTNNVIEMARQEKIEIFCLPPHTTHLYQPLDVAVFKSLKENFKKIVHSRMRRLKNLQRKHFGSIFSKAWDISVTRLNIKSGFKISGLWPVNKDKIDMFLAAANQKNSYSSGSGETSPTTSNSPEKSSPSNSPTSRVVRALNKFFPSSPEHKSKNGRKRRCVLTSRCITSDEYLAEKNRINDEKKKMQVEKRKLKEARIKSREEKRKTRELNLQKKNEKFEKKQQKIVKTNLDGRVKRKLQLKNDADQPKLKKFNGPTEKGN